MLFLDGVYGERPDGSLRFRWVRAQTSTELAGLIQTLARRIGRFLELQGLLERDAENTYLAGDDLEAGPMEQLLGSSKMCRDARMSRAQDAQERPSSSRRAVIRSVGDKVKSLRRHTVGLQLPTGCLSIMICVAKQLAGHAFTA